MLPGHGASIFLPRKILPSFWTEISIPSYAPGLFSCTLFANLFGLRIFCPFRFSSHFFLLWSLSNSKVLSCVEWGQRFPFFFCFAIPLSVINKIRCEQYSRLCYMLFFDVCCDVLPLLPHHATRKGSEKPSVPISRGSLPFSVVFSAAVAPSWKPPLLTAYAHLMFAPLVSLLFDLNNYEMFFCHHFKYYLLKLCY